MLLYHLTAFSQRDFMKVLRKVTEVTAKRKIFHEPEFKATAARKFMEIPET